MRISKNFKLNEFTKSDTATKLKIDNTKVPDYAITNLKLLVEYILQPLRDKIKYPIKISSGYRCLQVNAAVGGVPSSQHVLGQASDIKVSSMTPYQVAKTIVELNLPFDQLILYPTFCHVSYGPKNRRKILFNKSYSGCRDF